LLDGTFSDDDSFDISDPDCNAKLDFKGYSSGATFSKGARFNFMTVNSI
jgi:hypothetical protein